MTTTTHLTPTEEKFQRRVDLLSSSLPAWRTPQRRQLLVRGLWATIFAMSITSLISYFWFPIALAWVPLGLMGMVLWTMLRTVIDCKDTAPLRFLDEFEAEELLKARSRAFNFVSGALLVMALVLIFGAAFTVGDGHRLAFAVGGFGIFIFMAGSVIPAARMARLMDDED